MNAELLLSKKFRTACLAALTSLLTFLVSEFGLKIDIEKTIALVSTISVPFYLYIAAEAYSEKDAKKVVEEANARKELSNALLDKLKQDTNKDELP